MTLPDNPPVSTDHDAIDANASVLMKRGISLMQGTDEHQFVEAIACFAEALELRRRLPIDEVPNFRYGLAACLLNRADALVRLGGPERVEAAIHDYEESIVLLRALPLGADPRFLRRLAIAHQNLGLALQARGGGQSDVAVTQFNAALAVLREYEDTASAIGDLRYLTAVIWMNLANAQSSYATGQHDDAARESAARAMALVSDIERDDAYAAEIGLTARHVLCRILATPLSQPAVIDATMMSYVHAATDAVDDGLRLARLWESKGVSRFHGIATDLFRFGFMVYGKYQPQFVDEFMRENAPLQT